MSTPFRGIMITVKGLTSVTYLRPPTKDEVQTDADHKISWERSNGKYRIAVEVDAHEPNTVATMLLGGGRGNPARGPVMIFQRADDGGNAHMTNDDLESWAWMAASTRGWIIANPYLAIDAVDPSTHQKQQAQPEYKGKGTRELPDKSAFNVDKSQT